MADKPKMNAVCKGCGKPLSADEKGDEYCSRCMIERVERVEPVKPLEPEKPAKPEKPKKSEMPLASLGAAFKVISIPKVDLKKNQNSS